MLVSYDYLWQLDWFDIGNEIMGNVDPANSIQFLLAVR
uniref:Uncharacterized protein n=1 Tax=Arundo donax TaxID=35708 RepID=A0A0A9HC24_ARUDO